MRVRPVEFMWNENQRRVRTRFISDDDTRPQLGVEIQPATGEINIIASPEILSLQFDAWLVNRFPPVARGTLIRDRLAYASGRV